MSPLVVSFLNCVFIFPHKVLYPLIILLAFFYIFSTSTTSFFRYGDQNCTTASQIRAHHVSYTRALKISAILCSIPFTNIVCFFHCCGTLDWHFHQAIHYDPKTFSPLSLRSSDPSSLSLKLRFFSSHYVSPYIYHHLPNTELHFPHCHLLIQFVEIQLKLFKVSSIFKINQKGFITILNNYVICKLGLHTIHS